MMRLLHTSDWHLGATLHGVSCDPDHRRFIQWLVETLDSESIDVVVVVGNIFDLAQPSAEAQSLFYEFLALASATRVRRIVVVGGNHDSATRLDATRPVMEALKIHIVGGLSADEASWEQALCPVHNSDGALLGVVAAVPYVHEFRLGVRTTSGDVRGMAEATRRGFKHLYTTLADGAAARFPDVPLVATGHLTCSGAGDDDYGTPIHQVASIGGLPPEVFDPRFDYVALGHVHRSFQVGPGPVWYSGSPIPLKLHDMAAPRRVLLVEVATSTETRVSPLEVPVFRELLAVEGDADSVADRIATVQSPAPFGPLIFADVAVDHYEAGLHRRLTDALAARDDASGPTAPHLVRIRQTRDANELTEDADTRDAARDPTQRLGDLSPEEVFVQLCRTRDEALDDRLLMAFRSLLSDPLPEPFGELRATPCAAPSVECVQQHERRPRPMPAATAAAEHALIESAAAERGMVATLTRTKQLGLLSTLGPS